MKDAWEFKEYRDFFGLAMNNLLEKEDECVKDKNSVFSKILTEKKVRDYAIAKDHCHQEWNITDDSIKKTMENLGLEQPSFYFVFRWL
jgi:hypothetical protein